MNATIAAHDLRTHDCAWPGCPRESRREGGYCDQGHVGTPPAGAGGRVEPGSLAHLTDDEPVKEPAMPVCKVPGCTNPTAGKKGSWVGLCTDCISVEGRRRQALGRATAAVKPPPADGQSKRTPAAPKAPEPAPQAALNGQAEGTLVDLARAVTAAKQALAHARQTHEQAVQALRDALDTAE